jgi:glycosyltransferase involved in cell wall biosynthesis
MDAAAGEYIQFFDADDLAEKNFLSTLYKTASENGADIAFCGYRTLDAETGEETPFHNGLDPTRSYAGDELALRHISGGFVTFNPTLLYRRNLLVSNGLRFWEGCVASGDMEFMLRALTSAARVAFSGERLYVYVQHGEMISNSFVTPEKKLTRYAFRVEGRLRAAKHMAEHAKTPSVARAARDWLVPLWQQKMFNVYSWRGDKKSFDDALRSPEVRSNLLAARGSFFKDPGLSLKILALLALPGVYYEYRSRHIDYSRT